MSIWMSYLCQNSVKRIILVTEIFLYEFCWKSMVRRGRTFIDRIGVKVFFGGVMQFCKTWVSKLFVGVLHCTSLRNYGNASTINIVHPIDCTSLL